MKKTPPPLPEAAILINVILTDTQKGRKQHTKNTHNLKHYTKIKQYKYKKGYKNLNIVFGCEF